MTKTKLTLTIENALINRSRDEIGVYGALEVTVGKERCDYVEYHTDSSFTCYEIKVSKSDFNSHNKQTYLGERNYLVAPLKLANEIKNEHCSNLAGIGIIGYDSKKQLFMTLKKCSKHTVNYSTKSALLEGFAKAASRDFMKGYN